jgi:hypothetical protein
MMVEKMGREILWRALTALADDFNGCQSHKA